MKWKIYLPWVLTGITIIFILVKAFGPTKSNDDKYLKMLLDEKDDRIKVEREYRMQEAERYQQDKAEFQRRDSMRIEQSKVNKVRYEAIPVNVRNLNRDELRRAIFERYNLPAE